MEPGLLNAKAALYSRCTIFLLLLEVKVTAPLNHSGAKLAGHKPAVKWEYRLQQ